jgi:hypothetical protein
MLWVTMTMVYLVLSSCIRSSIAPVAIGSSAEAGSFHEDDVWLDGDGAGDAQPLGLAAGQAQA